MKRMTGNSLTLVEHHVFVLDQRRHRPEPLAVGAIERIHIAAYQLNAGVEALHVHRHDIAGC